jgi:hypothetical protein
MISKYRRHLELEIDMTKKGNFPCHMTVKLAKIQSKERILDIARENCQVTYKGKSIRITAVFSQKLKRLKGHRII